MAQAHTGPVWTRRTAARIRRETYTGGGLYHRFARAVIVAANFAAPSVNVGGQPDATLMSVTTREQPRAGDPGRPAGGRSPCGRHLILYDGVCGLCNRLVQFILPRDRGDVFVFAALQSDLAAKVLARHGRDASAADTFFVVRDYETPRERLLDRSDAGLFVAKTLGRGWQLVGPLRFIPRPIRDMGYGLVAGNRYRVFGRLDQCMLPSPDARQKFLDA
jgi:predicted DCC family thiol-disulfide oxidoreductase YuxK